jgi:hypothetical protein
MNSRLLRAIRFHIRRQTDRVLVHEKHPRLRRGPRWLAPLFDAVPSSFLVYCLLAQRVAARRYTLPRSSLFSVNRTQKAEVAIGYFSDLLGRTISLSTYRRNRSALAALAWRSSEALGPDRARSLRRWLRAIDQLCRGQDRHIAANIVIFLLAYADLYRLFGKTPPAAVLTVSDLSARRIAAAAAANAQGVPVLYWQLHSKNNFRPPFQVDAAVVVGKSGYVAARRAAPAGAPIVTRVVGGPITRPRRLPPQPVRLGVALNNFVSPKQLKETLREIRHHFPGSTIRVRRHPNSEIGQASLGPQASVTPKGETLAAFAASCDVAFVGNSSVQIELLSHGSPVVHLPGLDYLDYDQFDFVTKGVICGAADVASLYVAQVNDFYAHENWPERVADALDLFDKDADDSSTVDEFVSWLDHCLRP